jgi:hypothetical protein
MEQDYTATISPNARQLGGKAWTAYFGIGLIAILLFFVATPLAWITFWPAGVAVLIVAIVFVGYRFLVLRSYDLYYDDVGVWVYSGILPWKKGVAGIKWRDLDEAVYFQTFWSWLFKSYSVRIGHRFAKSSEILLTHMAHGHESAMEINAHHQELVRANALG